MADTDFDIETMDGEEVTEETFIELSNGRGDDEQQPTD